MKGISSVNFYKYIIRQKFRIKVFYIDRIKMNPKSISIIVVITDVEDVEFYVLIFTWVN